LGSVGEGDCVCFEVEDLEAGQADQVGDVVEDHGLGRFPSQERTTSVSIWD
jgi:hypothetical protein